MPTEHKTKILVVAHCFPPQAVAGAFRMLRFCRHLPAHGIHPIVLTVQDRFAGDLDQTYPSLEGLEIERTVMHGTPLDWYRSWKRRRRSVEHTPEDAQAGQVQKGESFWRRQALALLQGPDLHWGWYWPALRVATRILKRESVAAILSSGPPWISHLVAKTLCKRFRLPWLADFRDPWWQKPGRAELPPWRQWLDHGMEGSCLRRASLVLCNTDRLRDLFVQQYPDCRPEKFVVLTNGFDDPVAPPRDPRPKKGRRLLLHLGSLYVGRRVDTFCEAITGLIHEGSLQSGSFQVLFLGDADQMLVAAAERRAPELVRDGSITFQGRVCWQKAQEKLWEADVLLLFQGNLRVEIPAKLFEYLPTGRPILAVVKKGALSDLLDSISSGFWADPDHPSEIAQQLRCALEQPPRDPLEVQRELFDRFHYRALTARLASLIRRARGDISGRSGQA